MRRNWKKSETIEAQMARKGILGRKAFGEEWYVYTSQNHG